MPRKMTSAEARQMARARWNREREAVRAGLAASLDFEILTGAQLNDLVAGALRHGAEGALAQVGPAVIISAAEVGVDRATAERIADLAMLLTATAIQAAGGPEVSLPTPEAWRATVAWNALYADGKSLVTGAIARESAAEMAEAGGD